MATDPTEDRTQAGRKHIFVINGATEFLNLLRDVFQDERSNVITTNYVPNSFGQAQARAALGSGRYLVKPFDLDNLLAMIQEMIREAQPW